MKTWTQSDLSKTIPMRSNDLEFQDNTGEWHHFIVIQTPDRIVFGSCCNTGFLEDGYLEREDHESLDESLQKLFEDLLIWTNEGKEYTIRITIAPYFL